MGLLGNIIGWRGSAFIEKFTGKTPVDTAYKEVWIKTASGHSIYAHIHRPITPGKFPGVVFVPGGGSPGTDYDKGNGVRAKDVASLGFVALHYDPSGRGKSSGKEDYWGPLHQQELSQVVDYFSHSNDVMENDIGIMSFSIGITIASGALARFPMPKVRYLFDWEGPSNRFNTTKNDTHKPLKGFPTSNDEFWKEREAATFIGDIECAYFRYQADIDHVQEGYKGHAIELLNNATKGKALWTRCNDNPTNSLFDEKKTDEYYWVPQHLNHKGQVLKYLIEVADIKCTR
ncbi:MAG: hypothetical protein Q7T53_05305 [Deltaproteobacteria bacterium]|nr:hypothetical protein [Deltaproteobacteria bacterium]